MLYLEETQNKNLAQQVLTAYSHFKKQYEIEFNAKQEGLDLQMDEHLKISKDSHLSLNPDAHSILKIGYTSGKYSQIIFKAYQGIIKMTEISCDKKAKRALVVRAEDFQLVSSFIHESGGTYQGAIHSQLTPSIYEYIGGYH